MHLNPRSTQSCRDAQVVEPHQTAFFLFFARPALLTPAFKLVRPQVGFPLPACHSYDSLESARSLLPSPQERNRFPSSLWCAQRSLKLPMLALATSRLRTNVCQMGLRGSDVRLVDKVTFQQILHEAQADQVATNRVRFCRGFRD